MLSRIKTFFDARLQADKGANEYLQEINTAAAALMVEVVAADDHHSEEEYAVVGRLLADTLALDKTTIDQLIELSRQEVSEATSLYQFTRLINEHYDHDDKFQLLVSLWRVAYADGEIDKYEEGIIRRIAELIYLHHGEFIRAKHLARK